MAVVVYVDILKRKSPIRKKKTHGTCGYCHLESSKNELELSVMFKRGSKLLKCNIERIYSDGSSSVGH